MFLFRYLARAFLLSRLMRRGQRRRARRYGGYGRRGRVGFFGPMPYYSGRTRRGTRVQVSGCCLPIPLALAVASAVAARALLTRR
jgi:hypothetical protein